ncbi:DUF5666 domain-containing protein [Marinimicrobium agarilyticum]|uniref:DUF5666 domain-containing protein n=1 Tax=Marinimicrobium agarilyticum TaxID=306546 RepID=UPI0004225E76|nr:DUF5666 domain-containing protein [Marinimicrobium agarilyticum]
MKTVKYIATPLLAILLGGCLSDSDSTAGIEGTGSPATVVSGSVTAYGSIYVNGLHVEIDTAEVSVNGEPGAVEDIQLGMVVEVELAELDGDQALADEVRYTRLLQGSINTVSEASDVRKVLTVLGQTVVVYDDIQFDGVAFEALSDGVGIDVSGHLGDSGHLIASRVSAVETVTPDVVGTVKSLDAQAQRFRINDLWVSFAGSEVIGGDLAEGLRVRVTGGALAQGELAAETVAILPRSAPEDGSTLFQEGVIGRFASLSDFEVAGVRVNASEADRKGGTEALASGVRVAVEGRLVEGVLMAEQLRVLRHGVNRIRTEVGAVDEQAGVLTLMGTSYHVSELTAFEDVADGLGNRNGLNLSQLRAGDAVEVFAFYRGDKLVVTRVKRLDPSEQTVEIRGPVTAIHPETQSIRVTGVTVWLEGAQGAELLADLSRGDQVQVEGELTGQQQLEASSLRLSELPGDVKGGCPDFVPQCGGKPDIGVGSGGPEARGPTLRF